MKLKRILAAALASVVAMGAMATSAFAADTYKATIGFADMSFGPAQDWETSVDVTGDGTYTISSSLVAGAPEIGVFVINLVGVNAAVPDATATLDSVKIDGSEIAFDAAKIVYGDLEKNGNYRIEIYNQYGPTKDAPPIDNKIAVSTSIEVTFTVSGLAAPAADNTDTSTPADTGVTPVAALAIVTLAGAAIVATKKR